MVSRQIGQVNPKKHLFWGDKETFPDLPFIVLDFVYERRLTGYPIHHPLHKFTWGRFLFYTLGNSLAPLLLAVAVLSPQIAAQTLIQPLRLFLLIETRKGPTHFLCFMTRHFRQAPSDSCFRMQPCPCLSHPEIALRPRIPFTLNLVVMALQDACGTFCDCLRLVQMPL